MNSFIGIAIAAAIIYGILVNGTYFKIYIVSLVGYIILTQIGTTTRYNNKRKKCNISTWNGKSCENNNADRSKRSSNLLHLRMGHHQRRGLFREKATRNKDAAYSNAFRRILCFSCSEKPASTQRENIIWKRNSNTFKCSIVLSSRPS